MTLDSAAAAVQACSNQTINALANWRCSYGQPHTSSWSNAGYTAGHSGAPLVIGIIVVLAVIAVVRHFISGKAAASN